MISFCEPAWYYHSHDATGSTDIRAYIKSPRLFKDIRDGLAIKETEALLFGSASHMALLEPVQFAESVAFKPRGMNFSTVEGKLWKAAQEADGKFIVTAEDADHLKGMHARMPADVRKIFDACKPEVTVRTKWNGILAQCRFDLFSHENWDLKSIDAIENVERSIYQRGYHIQKRVYQRIHAAETGGPLLPFRFLFAEKCPPYRWRVVELDSDYDAIADEAIDGALHGIVARNKSGCWDDPGELHLIASPPSYLTEYMNEE